MQNHLTVLTVAELRKLATERKLKGRSKLTKKCQLIEALSKNQENRENVESQENVENQENNSCDDSIQSEKEIEVPHTFDSAMKFAEDKLAEHGLSDWKLVLTRKKRVAGTCYYKRHIIELSVHRLKFSRKGFELTVLHEIAHALVSNGHHHDDVWKQKCIDIGGDGNKTCSSFYKREYKYAIQCITCKGEKRFCSKPGKFWKEDGKYRNCFACGNQYTCIKL